MPRYLHSAPQRIPESPLWSMKTHSQISPPPTAPRRGERRITLPRDGQENTVGFPREIQPQDKDSPTPQINLSAKLSQTFFAVMRNSKRKIA